jgi:APA family basic amino acid/polyamine antiporter
VSRPQASGAPRRVLGFWMCTALVMGNTIGMGIFLLPASLAPYGWNALVGWVVTVLGCVLLARVFARLARRLPGEDGPFAWIRVALGPRAAFVVGWCYWVSVWVTLATLAVGVVGYLGALWPPLAALPAWPLALALVWTFVGVSLLGARAGGGVQVATTALKLLPMVAMAALGAWLLATEPAALRTDYPRADLSFGAVLAASTIALFAMLGIESASFPARSVREPERTIPRATLVGTVLTGLVYIAVCAVPMLLLPPERLAASGAPFADAFESVLGQGSGRWIALFVAVSGLGALNGWTLLAGELTRTMAREGALPAALGAGNRHGAPWSGLLLSGMLASGMVVMSYSGTLAQGFTFLTTVVTAANLPLYLGCALALLALWRRDPPASRDAAAWAALLGGGYAMFAFAGVGAESLAWALALAASGVPVYLWARARARASA